MVTEVWKNIALKADIAHRQDAVTALQHELTEMKAMQEDKANEIADLRAKQDALDARR